MKQITTRTDLRLTNSKLSDGLLIFQNAHSSSLALFQAFELARKERGRNRGITTNLEQDILRAMLVMAYAGLDAGLKQVIQDVLPLYSFRQTRMPSRGWRSSWSGRFVGRRQTSAQMQNTWQKCLHLPPLTDA